MTACEEADRLLPAPDKPNFGRLKPGDLNAEGTLRMVHGPYPARSVFTPVRDGGLLRCKSRS